MYKYIFYIIFGIILFLIYNNIDGLNIGEDCENNIECNSEGGDCHDNGINKCYCYFNKCKTIDSVNDDANYNPIARSVCGVADNSDNIVRINMLANGYYGTYARELRCQLGNDCWLYSDKNYTSNDYYYDNICGDNDACKEDHSARLCVQSCPVNIVNNSNKDLVNAGFENVKIIDLNDEVEKNIYETALYDRDTQKSLISEYHLYKYLERKYNSRCKKIKDGIVYIKSRIFYYTTGDGNLRYRIKRTSDFYHFFNETDSPFRRYFNQRARFQPLHLLHIDYTDFKKYGSIGVNKYGEEWNQEDWDRSIYTNPSSANYIDKYDSVITAPLYGNNNPNFKIPAGEQTNLYKQIANSEDTEIETINIWIKLVGSTDFTSLALVDTIDDNKLVNELQYNTINDYKDYITNHMTSIYDNGSINKKYTRINQFAHTNANAININNNVSNNPILEKSEYDIDLNKLYVFPMNDGDALVFKTTQTPHTAVYVDDQWRLTYESRYSYTNKPFNISDIFEETSDTITVKSDYDSNNSKLHSDSIYNNLTMGVGYFSIDTVLENIIDLYNRLKSLYETSYTELYDQSIQIIENFTQTFNIVIFISLMDNLRFEYFEIEYNDNDDLIKDNIKKVIRKKNLDEECNPEYENDCAEWYSCQYNSTTDQYTCELDY